MPAGSDRRGAAVGGGRSNAVGAARLRALDQLVDRARAGHRSAGSAAARRRRRPRHQRLDRQRLARRGLEVARCGRSRRAAAMRDDEARAREAIMPHRLAASRSASSASACCAAARFPIARPCARRSLPLLLALCRLFERAGAAGERGRSRRAKRVRSRGVDRSHKGKPAPDADVQRSRRRRRSASPTSRACRCWSICGRPGARRASRNCRRSTELEAGAGRSTASWASSRSARTWRRKASVEAFLGKLEIGRFAAYHDPEDGAVGRARRRRSCRRRSCTTREGTRGVALRRRPRLDRRRGG